MDVYYSTTTQRIEFIYIVATTKEEALKIMQNKKWIANTLRRFNTIIRSLPNDVSKAIEFFPEPENVLVLIKPCSYLEVVSELPAGPILLEQLKNVIKIITKLEFEEFTIEPDQDPITKEPDYTQLFVVFPSKSFVDKVYNCQPFFGSVIAHKLTHLQITPYLRYSKEVCLTCDNDKHPESVWDMCVECSSKQRDINVTDAISVAQVAKRMAEKKK